MSKRQKSLLATFCIHQRSKSSLVPHARRSRRRTPAVWHRLAREFYSVAIQGKFHAAMTVACHVCHRPSKEAVYSVMVLLHLVRRQRMQVLLAHDSHDQDEPPSSTGARPRATNSPRQPTGARGGRRGHGHAKAFFNRFPPFVRLTYVRREG